MARVHSPIGSRTHFSAWSATAIERFVAPLMQGEDSGPDSVGGRLDDCGKRGEDRIVVIGKGGDIDGRCSGTYVRRADRAALLLLRCRLTSVNRSRLGGRGTLVQLGGLTAGRSPRRRCAASSGAGGGPNSWSRLEGFCTSSASEPRDPASWVEPSCWRDMASTFLHP